MPGVVGLSGDSTVLTESGHQFVPQGRGKEIVLSCETLTEASLLINLNLFNHKVSRFPGWVFHCHRMCDSGTGGSGTCWVPQCLCTPRWGSDQMKWPQNIFGFLHVRFSHSGSRSQPGSVPRACQGQAWAVGQGWEQREGSPGLPWQVLEGEDPAWSLLVSSIPILCPCPSLMVPALGESGGGWHL